VTVAHQVDGPAGPVMGAESSVARAILSAIPVASDPRHP
jgi:hypothetical protein